MYSSVPGNTRLAGSSNIKLGRQYITVVGEFTNIFTTLLCEKLGACWPT